jgi:hypothetical protein
MDTDVLPIVARQSVGPFRLGMLHNDVLNLIGQPSRKLYQRFAPEYEVNAYDDHRIHIIVDRNARVVAVRAFSPLAVKLYGIHVLGRNVEELEVELHDLSVVFRRNETGLWCPFEQLAIVNLDEESYGVELGIADFFYGK